jgi:serine acetyltransferase
MEGVIRQAVATAGPSFLQTLQADFVANRRNPKGALLVLMYRIAHSCIGLPPHLAPIQWFTIFAYKILTEYILGTEIHWRSTFGPGLCVFHGYGLVVNSGTKAGKNCILRHNVTIGTKETSADTGAPVIGNNVDIGASAIILGPIKIGDYCAIGAGCVVVKSLPIGAVAVGNPARIIGVRSSLD